MKLTRNGVELAYEVRGDRGPWVVFSHSLGCTRGMWDRQLTELSSRFRVLAYDLPGHGDSDVDTNPGSLSSLASDVMALLDHIEIANCHFVGISIGGMIGQALAIEAPDRFLSLVLANTTAFMPPLAQELWTNRIRQARSEGVSSLAQSSIDRWFPDGFRKAHPALISRMVREFSATSLDGYVRCSQAISGLDTRAALPGIRCPVLIIGGTEDPGAPLDALRQMNQAIPSSKLLVIEGAGHLSNLDRPEVFSAALKAHLEEHG